MKWLKGTNMKLKMMKLNDLFNDIVLKNSKDEFFDTEIYYQGHCYDDAYRIKDKHHFVNERGNVKSFNTLSCLIYAFIERVELYRSEKYEKIITKENIHQIDDKYDSQAYGSYVLKYSRNLDIDYWCNENNENLGQSAIINQGKIQYSDLDLSCQHIKRRINKFRWEMVSNKSK